MAKDPDEDSVMALDWSWAVKCSYQALDDEKRILAHVTYDRDTGQPDKVHKIQPEEVKSRILSWSAWFERAWLHRARMLTCL
jgi:hypothetical protein